METYDSNKKRKKFKNQNRRYDIQRRISWYNQCKTSTVSVMSVVIVQSCLVKPGRSSTLRLFLGCDAAQNVKAGEKFMSKDDPRAATLMQRPKLSGSLAIKVNADSSEQCLEDAWKVRNSHRLLHFSRY